MLATDPVSAVALAAALIVLLSLIMLRRRPAQRGRSRSERQETLDTVASWQPEAARVLTAAERKAYETVRKALPSHMVLAQVPLSRFLKVPTRHSYSQWLSRVGSLNADLVAGAGGDRRPADQPERARTPAA
jgi:hypothetical protein